MFPVVSWIIDFFWDAICQWHSLYPGVGHYPSLSRPFADSDLLKMSPLHPLSSQILFPYS